MPSFFNDTDSPGTASSAVDAAVSAVRNPRVHKMSQFAGSDCLIQLPNTSLYVDRSYLDKGRGLLSVEEG